MADHGNYIILNKNMTNNILASSLHSSAVGNWDCIQEESGMCFNRPNRMLELMAWVRYSLFASIPATALQEHIEYNERRWYRFDRSGNIVKIARSYFDVMQP